MLQENDQVQRTPALSLQIFSSKKVSSPRQGLHPGEWEKKSEHINYNNLCPPAEKQTSEVFQKFSCKSFLRVSVWDELFP